MRSRPGAAVLVCLALTATAAAETDRPRGAVIEGALAEPVQLPPSGLVPYNTLYLNRCPGNCTISPGSSNSINDRWDVGTSKILSKFPFDDATWNEVVACVKDVFSPYNVNVVTSAPSGDHFEIMIAGLPTELNSSWTNYLGVAPGYGQCSTYLDDALVFVFAKMYGGGGQCDAACVNEMCATAAQEIGHVWKKMDHVRLASDPMTYFGYSGRRYYQDMEAECGSDCVNGINPNSGEACTGVGSQTHSCWCTGDTQNSHQIVKGLFGLGPGTPPTAKITSPKYNESVEQMFPVYADISDDSLIISKVEFKVDGMIVTTLTKGPFVFAAPPNLAEGTHHVEVIAYDGHNTPGSGAVDVIIGPPCEDEGDCQQAYVCVGGRCVPGPTVSGGLGTDCQDSTLCSSQRCASDGTNNYCVELCMVGDCPDGFGCLDTGEELGVCWPGYDDGSGGCGCQTSRGGPAGMILALLVMVVTCRRRRS